MTTFPRTPLRRRHFLAAGSALAGWSLGVPAAHANTPWPTKAVTVVVPYAPGGQGDVFARLIGDRLGRALGQPMIVDNRPGASGALGSRLVARAEADGHTLLMGQTGEIVVNAVAMRNPGYDALKDLRPVALVVNAPLVMAVPANSPFRTLGDLVQAARAKPGSVAYASSGTATPGHLAAAALASGTSADLLHIPYKGAGQAITDLIGGQVQFFFSSASAIVPHIQGGKVRALAIGTPQRVTSLPGVPSVSDTVPGFNFSLWGGYFAPRATPDAVVERLNAEINKIIVLPEIQARYEADGSAVEPQSAARFGSFLQAEATKYAQLVKTTGAQID